MPKNEWPEDWTVEWPARKCREAVWMTINEMPIAHSCDLGEDHGGRCASMSHAESIKQRKAWLEREAEALRQLMEAEEAKNG